MKRIDVGGKLLTNHLKVFLLFKVFLRSKGKGGRAYSDNYPNRFLLLINVYNGTYTYANALMNKNIIIYKWTQFPPSNKIIRNNKVFFKIYLIQNDFFPVISLKSF